MKKILIIITIVILGFLIFSNSGNDSAKNNGQNNQVSIPTKEVETTNIAATVIYDGKSFSPEIVEINKRETVLFINESTLPMWVASDPHPMHTNLPAFNQFTSSGVGESYRYSFVTEGEWNYHNHMSPFMFGTVVVR